VLTPTPTSIANIGERKNSFIYEKMKLTLASENDSRFLITRFVMEKNYLQCHCVDVKENEQVEKEIFNCPFSYA